MSGGRLPHTRQQAKAAKDPLTSARKNLVTLFNATDEFEHNAIKIQNGKYIIKLTQWFDADTKPTRIGVYERDDKYPNEMNSTPSYSYWDGEFWSCLAESPKEALKMKFCKSQFQNLKWRGLTENLDDKTKEDITK